jgi:hypothetical protein
VSLNVECLRRIPKSSAMRSFQLTKRKVPEVSNLHQYCCQNLKSCIFKRGWGLGLGVWSEVSFKNYTQNFFIRHGPAYKNTCCAIWVSRRPSVFPTWVPQKKNCGTNVEKY